jgi:rhodanese-related sulfurtransferase
MRYKRYPAGRTLILVDDTLGQKTARETAGQLSEKGQERVYVLDGGIAVWELEGYPVVKEKPLARAVTKEELKWALANMVHLKIFDMRDASEREKGSIQGSLQVEGKDTPERLGNIRELLKKEAGTDIAKRLKKKTAVVLVFPETEDASGLTEKMLREVKADVRYLLGGYRTFAMDKMKQPRMSGSCPACPAQ